MPFTPLHLGAGAAFKAVGGRHFSFMVFGGTQVMMDIEPLVGIIRDSDVLHGYSHTLLGAALIGALAGTIGRPISVLALILGYVSRIPHLPGRHHSPERGWAAFRTSCSTPACTPTRSPGGP